MVRTINEANIFSVRVKQNMERVGEVNQVERQISRDLNREMKPIRNKTYKRTDECITNKMVGSNYSNEV